MRKYIYLLTFDPAEVDKNEMHNAMQSMTNSGEILAWSHFIKTSYIIISRNMFALDISQQISNFLSMKKFFIVEINYKNYNGYQQTEAWTWLKNQIDMIYFP